MEGGRGGEGGAIAKPAQLSSLDRHILNRCFYSTRRKKEKNRSLDVAARNDSPPSAGMRAQHRPL